MGTPGDGKLKVVTTLFPYYDFARQIAGDVVDLSMVIPAGQDSHSFEPTPADIRLIQNADLLICNGGTMEQWVTQVLGSLDALDLKVITMMDYVDVVQEEIVEGMEDSATIMDMIMRIMTRKTMTMQIMTTIRRDHDHADDDHAYEIEYDEHIWTSPVNAMKITQVIADTLEEMDPADAAVSGE